MKFWKDISSISVVFWIIKLLIPTGVNMLLINYASSRAMEQGDTDWLTIIILMISMLGSVALLLESIKLCRKVWVWQNLFYLLACAFNVYYFFKILSCCVPMAGDLIG